MFDIGALEFLVLGIAALFIFGPDRLPEMAKKAAHGLRQVRAMASNARRDLSRELGPEFDNFDVNDLNPRRFVRKHVLDDLDEDDLRLDKDLNLRDDLRVDIDDQADGSAKASAGASSKPVDGEVAGSSAESELEGSASGGSAAGGSAAGGSAAGGSEAGGGAQTASPVNGIDLDADGGDGTTATLTHKPPPFDPDAT